MRIARFRVQLDFQPNEILFFLLLASTLATAQRNPQALVSKMVTNELESQNRPRYWMYVDSKTKAGRTEVSNVIQTPECWITWPVTVNGHPLTEEEQKRAREQVEKLLTNADTRKKNRDEIDADGQKSTELLKL